MEDNNNNLYNYRLVIIIIQILLIFIISIAVISTFGKIKSKAKKFSDLNESIKLFSRNYSAISAIFSLEIILIILLCIGIILFFYKDKDIDIQKAILIMIIIYQFLYLIYCIITPIYLKEYKYLIKLNENNSNIKELKEIKNSYKGVIWICYIFLIIILVLDFILLNLYKNIFFNAKVFIIFLLETFCRGFYEKKDLIEMQKNFDKKTSKRKQLTEEIKELLAEKMNKEISSKKEEIEAKLNNK